MKKLLCLTALLFVFQCYAQLKVAELPVNYESQYFSQKESIAISNEKTGELVVFVEDYLKSYAYLLDSDMKVKSNFETTSLPISFKTFLGYTINEDESYTIFFSNNSKKKFGAFILDFKSKKFSKKTLDFKLKKEAYVEGVTFNGEFYLISVSKNASDLHFYTFNKDLIPTKKTVDFSFVNHKTSNGFSKTAHSLLVSKGFSNGSLTKIDETTPNAIENTCEPSKFYVFNNQFYFTFDHDKAHTIVVTVNPENFELNYKEYKQQFMGSASSFVNHNSYIHDNKLFQVIANTSKMGLKVTDLTSDILLKEINLNKEDTITFKNTPILQEKPGMFNTTQTREMEKTSKFLRKIAQGDIGISVYKTENNYELTIGSRKEVNTGGAPMMMGGFGAVGSIPIATAGAMSVSFNPVYMAYGGYTSTKSVRIECLFDHNFNHVEGNIADNIFDTVMNFEDSFDNSIPVKVSTINAEADRYEFAEKTRLQLKNIFRHQDQLFMTFLGSKDKNYHLIKFEN